MTAINKIDLRRSIRNTLLVIIGTMVLSFGVGIFIVPFELVTGGVTGLCIVIKHALFGVPFFGELEISVYVAVLNWILFALGFIFLGKAFAAKTFVSTLFYPIGLSIVTRLTEGGAFGGFLNLLSDIYAPYGSSALLIAAVFGGAAIGAGCALTFLGGGSSGGLDVLALILCKYFRRLKSSVLIFILDGTVVLLGMFVIRDLFVSLVGILAAFICAIAVDRLFIGESGAFVAYVVSDKYNEINEGVIKRLSRTTTILDAVGGYSGQGKKMVMVTFSFSQYADFTALIAAIDKNAFVTLHRAHEINGEGWTWGIHALGARTEEDRASEPAEADDRSKEDAADA